MSDAFERPKRVLVTRAEGQNETLSQALSQVGFVPVEFPTIRIVPPDDLGPLDYAISKIDHYDWLVFTSVNGVKQFWTRFKTLRPGTTIGNNLRLAAIGPATAAALEAEGLRVAAMPADYVAEALAQALGQVRGQKILVPTADIARDTLVEALYAQGAAVDWVTAYQTKTVTNPGDLPRLLPTLDALTFTSSSTVQNFFQLLPGPDPAQAVNQAVIACIGPKTARTARDLGLTVDLIAEPHTIPDLVRVLQDYFDLDTLSSEETSRAKHTTGL